jgi:translocator protein
LALVLGIGWLSGWIAAPQVRGWYQQLSKPSWNPPGWVFGPVWTFLYILMGISLYLVWSSLGQGGDKKMALMLFGVQILLNFFWSLIFFRQHQPGWAMAELVLMWFAIIATMFSFSRISPLAAWMLVPYISWVSFAGLLNYTIWKLNA